ncbi:calcium-binding protein, partial [Ideonella sp. DXS29W]
MTSLLRPELADADSTQISSADFLMMAFATGIDTQTGTAGDDIFHVDNAADVVIEAPGGGLDTIYTTVSYALPSDVEWLVNESTGSLRLTGNGLDNFIGGNVGNDTLDGGAGADTMSGASGSDTYYVDNSQDVVIESFSPGYDVVYTSVSYELSTAHDSRIEKLILTGTASLNLAGGSFETYLVGNSGANVLTGRSGVDTLEGGAGNDTYVASHGSTLIEKSGGGIDTVIVAGGFTLPDNFENLQLSGPGGVATGNSVANEITGTADRDYLDGALGADTLAGGDEDDSYYVDNAGDTIVELTGEGRDTVNASVSWALAANVEDLLLIGRATDGTGNALDNWLTGNDENNTLAGGAGADFIQSSSGNDILDGGQGADTLSGGMGNDTFYVDEVADEIINGSLDDGVDTVYSSINHHLAWAVENLTLTGSAVEGYGNDGINHIIGNAANNVLGDGGGSIGGDDPTADTLEGGLGDDTYILEDDTYRQQATLVIEGINAGVDTVISHGPNTTLASNVENLELTSEYDGVQIGIGNELNNKITVTGTAMGYDRLDGGLGADTLTGANGNDTYVVDSIGDKTIELAGEGLDLVESSISWTLQSEVENLTLSGTAATHGVGNDLANDLVGNSGANTLEGLVGADTLDGLSGADSLVGGAGNDVYYVDNVNDKTVELAGGGFDTTRAWLSCTLQDQIESLWLYGSAKINGTGNTLANKIYGNIADNVLDGGTGADTLTGGTGNDTYVVDSSGDRVVELANGGHDLVRSSVSCVLATEVEDLTLTGTATSATGNTSANVLVGNGSANVIDGKAGADRMTGGAGADIFAFTTALASDLITDFT